jgi:spore coat protein U-like protein
MPRPAAKRVHPIVGLALFVLFALAAVSLPGRASAQTCSFAVSPINFGQVSPINGPSTVSSTGTLSINCSNLTGLGLPVTMTLCPSLDAGSGGSNGASRLMTGPGGTMSYQLYSDSAATTPWGAVTFLVFNTVPTITLTSDNSGAIHATRTVFVVMNNSKTAQAGAFSSTFSGETFLWGLNLLTCAGITLGTIVTPPPFVVSVQMIADCNLTVAPLTFPASGLITAAVAAQANLSVTCTNNAPFSVSLGPGVIGTGPTTRKMTKGAESITYGLYQDSAHTMPWGDAAAGAATILSATGTGAAQTLTVYGLVPPQTTPSPGDYADSVVITLTY